MILQEAFYMEQPYNLCKNIRSNFSLDILSYIHDIAILTKVTANFQSMTVWTLGELGKGS